MQLSKTIKYVFFVTFFLLCYVHLQVKITDLAYKGKRKERYARELNEQNGYLTYAITMMKSSRHLGEKMLNDKSKMHFASLDQIVRISSDEIIGDKDDTQDDAEGTTSLLSFLPRFAQTKSGVPEQ